VRLLFAGSPAIAVPVLELLLREGGPGKGWELAGLLTNPDSPRGRSGRREATEACAAGEALAGELGRPLPVLKPEKLDRAAREAVRALGAELLLSFAYGKIFGPRFLALFPRGGLNIHPSLLPKYRGASPIQGAILGREAETGISLQRIAPELDTGDILYQESFPLSGRETAGELSLRAGQRSAELIGGLLRALGRGELAGRPQDSRGASYSGLLSREDGRINWGAPAAAIDSRIRAINPWPLAWTSSGGELLYLLVGRAREGGGGGGPSPGVPPGTVLGADRKEGILVQTGEGLLALSRLQYRARKALDWRAFLNGARHFTGSRLGEGDHGVSF
jgi:methionyl-tRNA formyltransferase